MYFVKTPWWLKRLYPGLTWDIASKNKDLFLTFDDGPHPVATPFVLDVLKQYNAKATFFCIGKNIVQYPEIYDRICKEGHRIGNHTYDHLNGWKTRDDVYYKNVLQAKEVIESDLFRPPYGRITKAQVRQISPLFKIIMWDVLSGDFDVDLSTEKSLQYVTRKSKPGSIIVFHDSEKAFRILQYVLPEVLQFFKDKGYSFKAIE